MPGIPARGDSAQLGSRARKAAQLRETTERNRLAAEAPTEDDSGQWYTVEGSEKLDAIAERHGCTSDDIWNHQDNQALVEQRGSPRALQDGDRIYIPVEGTSDAEPVGEGEYVAKPGDCILSIAKDTGHFWETIWDFPANAELKDARKQPNAIMPGDRVTVPPLHPKQEPGETEMRHRFVRRGEPAKLRLRVMHNGEPIINAPYELRIDEKCFEGNTDAEGYLQAPMPGNAKVALLEVTTEDQVLNYRLALGEVGPIESIQGVQRRLDNMGFQCPTDGEFGPKTRAAVKAFQIEEEVAEPSGDLDDETRELIHKRFGS